MRKLPFLLILFLIVSLVVGFNPPKLKAQEHYYTLNLNVDKPFYWKGETIQINATSNSSVQITLSLYWNWKTYSENELIYQNTKTANATWNLPTGNQKVGFYRIVANTSDRTITTWRTLIHKTDYVSASLPFSYVWDRINYTFQGRTLRAETTRDYLEIKYPKIPFQHRTRFFRNNMSFIIRLDNQTQGWKVDVAYFTMYGCLKWFVNGTLNSPKTFDFKLAHNPLRNWKKHLDSMRSEGNLVFDWSDIRKVKQAFTWNRTSKTLHVSIPESFSIDPSIFEDGFESGNFSAWTGTTESGTGELSVQSSEAREGTYASNSTVTSAADWHSANCYKTFGGESTIYARCYVYLDSWSGGFTRGIFGIVANIFGIINVRLESTRNVTARYRDGAAIIENTSDTILATGEWICLEAAAYVHATNGWVRIYVNDVELVDITQTGIDTDNYGNITRVIVGIINGQNLATTLFYDSVIVNTTYIGLIPTGITYNEWPDINVIFSLSNMRNIHLTLPFSINLRFLMSSSQLLYEMFQWNPSINLRFIMSSIATRLGFNLVNPSIVLRIIMSSTSQLIIGLFNVNPTINLRFILNSWNQLIAHYFQVWPAINLIFQLGSISIIPTIYTINDAIMIGAIAFIIAICGVVIAITKRD